MNWDQVQGKWKQLKGGVRQEWGDLTDNDYEMIAGSRDKLIGKLQERYGYAKEEAQKRVDDFVRKLTEPADSKTHSQTHSQTQHPAGSHQRSSQEHTQEHATKR
jgi:uncharacterized protein YjbJ (UPF0337 family)